jgi:hypothetical protein
MQVLKFNQCPLCHQTFSVKVSDSLGMAYGEFEAVEAGNTYGCSQWHLRPVYSFWYDCDLSGGKASSFISFQDSSLSFRVNAAKRVNKKAGL